MAAPDRVESAASTAWLAYDDANFYFAARIHLGDALFAAARDLPDGGVSAPDFLIRCQAAVQFE